jgi:hypothetical protein
MLHLPGKVGIRPLTEAFVSQLPFLPRGNSSSSAADLGAAPPSKVVTIVAILLVAGLTLLGILYWGPSHSSAPGGNEPGKKAAPAEAGKEPASLAPGGAPTRS